MKKRHFRRLIFKTAVTKSFRDCTANFISIMHKINRFYPLSPYAIELPPTDDKHIMQ